MSTPVEEREYFLTWAAVQAETVFCLDERGFQVAGVDAALSGLYIAQRLNRSRGRNLHLVCADARQLPFKAEAFEGVFCFGLLHEFTEVNWKGDVKKVMMEIERVLGPDGLLILAVHSGDPKKGLPQVQNFNEAMFDKATEDFELLDKREYDDLGCTGRRDYRIWSGVFLKPKC